MNKKLLAIAISLGMLSQASFAEVCPNVKDIKTKQFSGWTAYDSDNGTPLTPQRVAQLVTYIDQFALAEWVNTGKKDGGTIRCYYRDSHGSNLEAYFAKNDFSPDATQKTWYQVSGYMHCAAGSSQCAFNSNAGGSERQLARK